MNSLKVLSISLILCAGSACQTLSLSTKVKTVESVQLPFIKNSANECYYLDEFMPTPSALVNGKSGSLDLRYYTYQAANYKNWQNQKIVLSFYSNDHRCWSLFEEYYMVE
jgi:hypothetical protein